MSFERNSSAIFLRNKNTVSFFSMGNGAENSVTNYDCMSRLQTLLGN